MKFVVTLVKKNRRTFSKVNCDHNENAAAVASRVAELNDGVVIAFRYATGPETEKIQTGETVEF